MRALVISGGGSKGAFAGGIAEYLINDLNIDYGIFVGSSTGSLLIPHLATNKIDKIRKVYTNVSQKDIYSTCPFSIKRNKEGEIKARINHFNTLKMFLKGKKTFGEHKNLRNTIARTISRDDFEELKRSRKKVITVVSNITRSTVEYKYAKDCSYNDFLDWMWASCSFVPFMSIVSKNGYEYADGGFGNYIPIEEAIDNGATEIDVIVLSPRRRPKTNFISANAFDLLLRVFMFMQKQIAYDDVLIGHLESIYNKNVTVNFIFTPRNLTDYSFYFSPSQMTAWWEEGYQYAKEHYKTNLS
ncbi:MAG: patatin-like phospholipase family protein [Saprospiraceae bacterium]|nr:patatin-like phospholipase family protein [Bacteroidia bacterium]NNK89097.1 patatin-like phospholipase family protein [Saprospiraceae bacterium]